jgi:hypothetical protein
VFELRLQHVRSEMRVNMRKGLHAEDLTRFSFSQKEAAALEWEDETEFRLNGKMYDVVSSESKNGQLLIVCIPDSREEKLLSAYLSSQKKTSDPATAVWLKLANAPYLVRDLSFGTSAETKDPIIYYQFDMSIQQMDRTVQERPPEWS